MTKRIDIEAMAISLLRNNVIMGLRLMGLVSVMSLIGLSFIGLEAQAQNQEDLEAIQQGLSSIIVGGNVYGGGNKGAVGHNTTVNVKSGDLNNVFGGARMAEVGGRSFVNIEGEEAISDIFITNVYGGNDIAGTIGQTAASEVPVKTNVYPSGLTEVLGEGETKEDYPKKNAIDNTWKTFVRTSRSTKEEGGKTVEDRAIVIGSLYGGGNGDFYYHNTGVETTTGTGANAVTKVTYKIYNSEADCNADTEGNKYIALIKKKKGEDPKPDLSKTYLEILGGNIAHVYGGGNNATVTENTTICINNESDVLGSMIERYAKYLYNSSQYNSTGSKSVEYFGNLLFDYLKDRTELNTFQSNLANTNLNFARVYGGNNKTEMKIRPTWNLQQGIIRDLYSGGNEGNMTWREGLLLELDPEDSDKLIVENVYGGCRRADVRPLEANRDPVEENAVQLSDKNSQGQLKYNFPAGFPARVLVRGGQITNVYGGNDISGHIFGGNAVGIYTSVLGNVYGGGNGSYAYTDNSELGKLKTFEDYYYNKEEVKEKHNAENPTNQITSFTSVEALNYFRPDAEQVSIRLIGSLEKPTIIKGSVFLGGNSATIQTTKQNPKAEIKIGPYVIADKIFMGNNGEVMAKEEVLKLYAGRVDANGNVLTNNDGSLATTGGEDYSTIDLTNQAQMNTYMEGAAMSLNPNTEDRIVFDDTYVPYTTKIGSFFCGGNVGSMDYAGTQNMFFKVPVIIYDKIVGGCNNADVPKSDYNAAYEGGVLGAQSELASDGLFRENKETTGKIKDRLVLNFDGIKIEPRRWDDTFELVTSYDDEIRENGRKLIAGQEYYATNLRSSSFIAKGTEVVDGTETYYRLTHAGDNLEWNTALWNDGEDDFERTHVGSENDTDYDADRRLLSGNIYGGCYNSGHVNGNVVLNIKQDIIKRDEVFAETDDEGTIIEANRNSGVILDEQRDDLMAVALTVFGAGKGKGTEIWGSTTVNLNEGYAFQIFGGGEEGYVGKGTIATETNEGVTQTVYDDEGYIKKDYSYNSEFSSTVNLNGLNAGFSEELTGNNLQTLAEAEYLYGGGNEGDVCGNSYVYLGNGRIYDSFGGASDADVYGHAETYIGRQIKNGNIIEGFPWVRDIVYGGNDFGGTIHGNGDNNYKDKVRTETGADAFDVLGKIYNPDNQDVPHVLEAPVYVEYLQGRVDTIFGGGYGNYDYSDPMYQYEEEDEHGNLVTVSPEAPYIESTFVNFRPNTLANNYVTAVFGAGTGYPDYREGDKSQDHSYVLIDIPDGVENFSDMEVYGSGSYNGLGMRETVLPMEAVANPGSGATEAQQTAYNNYNKYLHDIEEVSAVVDLIRGKIGTAYGGSYNEGITRRTMVNVPEGSTINIGAIFGGAYGNVTLDPCDVYEANVNYHSALATLRYNPPRIISSDNNETLVGYDQQSIDNLALSEGESLAGNIQEKGSIYGGNNHQRRTLYAKINIDVPVNQKHYKYGTSKGYVYGAGCGSLTWAEYTEVNLNANPDPAKPGAQVWEVYGGGQDGLVINAPGIQQYINQFYSYQGISDFTDPHWKIGWLLGDGYDQEEFEEDFESGNDAGVSYVTNTYTNLNNPLVTPRIVLGEEKRFNTNVIINEGAYVGNYAYGGGLGHKNLDQSGNVYGTTYIALLGGEVKKDIYAAGSSGGVFDAFNVGAQSSSNLYGFTASTTAYIEGGTCRNVYGGGWEGNVGGNSFLGEEIDGETNVVIGIHEDQLPAVPSGKTETDYHFHNGIPAIQRNAYAGGEGGSIIGTANITVNNGRIGYVYLKANQKQDEQGYIVSVQEARAQDSDDSQTSSQLADRYEEKINDETNWKEGVWYGEGSLKECGNVFGSGYDDLSSVDKSDVTLYGGLVRNCVYGGGEIAIVGRGTRASADATTVSIDKAGLTNVKMFGGHVLRNVYGGGKGYNALGFGGGHNKYTEGYVFGQTRVNIYGGEIGTMKGVLEADEPGNVGNVFGGGDAGFVYSAYEDNNGELARGTKSGARFDGGDEGYYYKSEKGTNGNYSFITVNNEKILTEDCKVLVEPHAKVMTAVEINGVNYDKGAYVPTSDLNTLMDKETDGSKWESLDDTGIIIHNAVFAGGNIASKKQMFADIPSVFGNATASIHDVYHRDLITIGTGQVGGIYGDGNLTLVDGYRELNITNYGTDYYYITKKKQEQIGIEAYNLLTPREQDYYEVKYKCKVQCDDNESTTYTPGSTLLKDELLTRFAGTDKINDNNEPNPTYWVQVGQMSNYSGRLLNTIQRADFCGIFGSRMVMKGAKDRLVSADVDDNDYTINRVREVSLNKKTSITGDDVQHGNYFGIYNTVNYLGALTSDFDFGDNENPRKDTRKTDNTRTDYYVEPIANQQAYGTATFYDWKKEFYNDPRRNNGLSHNQVALASGVSLELLTEKTTGKKFEQKDWGIITGVVQLDLINVATGIGGGYVYAMNIHGVRKATGKTQTILTALNKEDATTGTPAAATMKSWEYIETNSALTGTYANQKEFQTSGNFVHNTKTILDDCYNIKNRYLIGNRVPAHYWYIQGSVYVYDQVISAYTGSPNAYSESVDIPLTITSASHGQLKLIDVKPNRYALYSSYTDATHNTKLTAGSQLVINDVTYNLNDPISYWDWSNLPESEQKLFVEETYVNCVDVCIDNGTMYPAGTYVMTATELEAFKGENDEHTYTDAEGHAILNNVYEEAGTDYVFRQSNNISHDNGYILTYQMNNPSKWDTWYTPSTGSASNKNQTGGNGYETAPTYRPSAEGLYGQQEYGVSEIITENIFEKYEGKTIDDSGNDVPAATSGLKQRSDYNTIIGTKTQATFERAYITTEYVETKNIHYIDQHLQEGAKLAKSQYTTDEWTTNLSGKAVPAYVSTTTIQLSETKFIYPGDLMTATQKATYKTDYPTLATDIEKAIVPAYYCTTGGYYGGDYYLTTNNYPAKETLNAMSGTDDFAKFKNGFNYDALDLLIDPNYGGEIGKKYQYDGNPNFNPSTATDAERDNMIYSLKKSVDYSATYNGTSALTLLEGQTVTVTHQGDTQPSSGVTKIVAGDVLDRTNYEENLINEQGHYIPITVPSGGGTYYVVNTSFYYNEQYAAGQIIDASVFESLPDGTNSTENLQNNVTQLTFGSGKEGTYYYCRDEYTIKDNYHPVKNIYGTSQTYSSGGTVPVGTIIGATNSTVDGNTYYGYANLTNQQTGFTIEGVAPVETSTLYVARNSDIKNLSKEKIITVVYQYDYEESNQDGTQISPVSERHVVNIHLRFVSGEPYVANIEAPGIVLPGTSVVPEAPSVVAGGYLIMNRGWEIYENAEDAKNHINGIEYVPSDNPLYWYQDGYQIAYYAKTYLGKHYSNYVPLSVANYHRMDDVLNLTTNEETGNIEITTNNHYMYLNQAVKGNKRNPKVYIKNDNELNKFAAFYNETRTKDELSNITGGQNIDFIIDGNINHSGDWTSIGTDDCFEGTLHGDGYTISGLNNSLFNNLCGDVYNLGVTGSFSGAGIAESGSGYIENGWISTSNTGAKTTKPVFGNPVRTGNALTSKGKIQIVNSYYQEEEDATNKYTNHDSDYGTPTRKPAAAFYNGEVAYDLNSFYLNKRYYNHQTLDEESRVSYKFLQRDGSGNLKETADVGYYPKDKATYAKYADLGYVESRYGDGDFRYAGGEIPTSTDKHERTYDVTTTTVDPETSETVTTTTSETGWFPVWPEDYLFFGQNLTFGYDTDKPHQSVPSHFYSNTASNRVYRAPAYFRNSIMSVAHYNPDAILAAKSADGTRDAYPGMTAIDFAGHNDISNGYRQGLNNQLFYQPLLDDDGLTSISNEGETSNLLVYAPAATSTSGYANEKTYTVLSSYFTDPKYSDYDETSNKYTDGKTYGRVAAVAREDVHGHLVLNDFTTPGDHLLVDRQDFNAPLSYKFGEGYRMWYQRTPDNFAETAWNNEKGTTIGWEGVSIPFEAEYVTTNTKGEITHFYRKDDSGTYEKGYNTGHEYWLRQFENVTDDTTTPNDIETNFKAPLKTSLVSKIDKNTFLWDYYYYALNRKDKNSDDYQSYQTEYYKSNRTYAGYPRITSGTPYIIGFPGEQYYEFDLSGKWTPSNTANDEAWEKMGKQTITFASAASTNGHPVTIGVSDTEAVGVTKKGLTFKPSYLNEEYKTADATTYLLNGDGSSFDQVDVTTQKPIIRSEAFRPYFTGTYNANGEAPRRIIISGGEDTTIKPDVEEHNGNASGSLKISVEGHNIIVESSLRENTTVRITTSSGITVTTFTIKPGQIVRTPVAMTGVYVVNRTKVIVK
ncbi:MAG: hypothetical protein IKN15_09140 [Bacteroidaceae bacterium]|nr:hypothetical protein [Bacteroidaceae bacterium]